MSEQLIRIGVRQWDHVVPLALGDVASAPGVRLIRSESTPDLWTTEGLEASETSLSKYVRARAGGDRSVVGLPIFLMRAFRQRCIIVRQGSDFVAPSQLRGATIGLTGWPDSGNTWTRAILRAEGVGLDDVKWRVGRLTEAHPQMDRIGIENPPATVEPMPGDEPMADALAGGALDAVMTPFMPPGFHRADSPFRPLFPDTRAAEQDYFRRHGFIPGIHLLAVRQDVLDARPEVAQQLVDTFETSKRLAHARRSKLTDVTPWQNEEIAWATRFFGGDWQPYGWSRDARMVAAFQEELVAQRLLEAPVAIEDLFPYPLEPKHEEYVA